ncbi:Fur-regulated basic protein B [Alteribacillus persepolensis]|uniref:Fur-regulated basic protein B n=1 Tax=Alteribacillus persepolensis TaxID=568899 RepID=A0A1G8CAW8_9BACI|nr:FbpB family small basic protein [Alteribacillus persepolensis]SDH42469.1 Fur-regulated basic protein B [Alteribacillus persepolensis]
MRKPMRSTLEDLINENKEELLRDQDAMSEIEKKLDDRKAREVYVEELENYKEKDMKYVK